MLKCRSDHQVEYQVFFVDAKIGTKLESWFRNNWELFHFGMTISRQKCWFLFQLPLTPSESSKLKKVGVFWKSQEICSKMDTSILKICGEMTEIIEPKVGSPSLNKNFMLKYFCCQNIVVILNFKFLSNFCSDHA